MSETIMPKFGTGFYFPENLLVEHGDSDYQIGLIHNACIKITEQYEDAVVEQIALTAKQAGATSCLVLDKTAIMDALNKQVPKKPRFVDTRFRNHGRHIADGCSLSRCYECPTCRSHIFRVFDSEHYCVHCGQLLDWEVN